ncbi:uncharacterized protein EV154DRAFT_459807 [Mucor mucedo]|uniref:uncharacterized protein n=1 Tax=Mucor mucedo TaxID=29922 RepID=UPI00221FB285|nr:uncharacterized protein EV154DRAFT_459807 [Mucor mucedo]KAI7894105.1 hypothetical protein EV154DRAFT_459807 [Mucor mucedo]
MLLQPGQIIETTGDNVVGLWQPSIVKVQEQLFVIGGGGALIDNLRVLDLLKMQWKTIIVKGKEPPRVYGHTATLWDNSIVVFGGCDASGNYSNAIHIYDIQKQAWSQPDIDGTTHARYLHSASVYNNKLFVYGGFAKNKDCTYVLNELNVLDLLSFSWSKYENVMPRYNHSSTLMGHKLYIYGGKDVCGDTTSDLYVIDLSISPYTSRFMLKSDGMMLLKSKHFSVSVDGKLLVFGKYHPDSMYGLWMLDFNTLQWTKQATDTHYFDTGAWNYFTALKDSSLVFVGNRDDVRPLGHDHFRDVLVLDSKSLEIPDVNKTLEVSRL